MISDLESGFSVFAMGIAYYLGVLFVGALAVSVFPAQMLKDNLTYTVINHLINIIALYCIGVPIFKTVSASLPSMKPLSSKMKFGAFLGGFCICVLAMSVGNYISNFILSWLYSIFGIVTQNPVEQVISPNDPAIVIVTIAFMVVLVPVLEELLFRRIICSKLLPLGEGYAIFLSGAIFGLIHGNFYQFPYAFLLGVFFAFIYIKTGKLIYSIIYHMAINLMGSVIAPWIMTLIDTDALNEALESEGAVIPESLVSGMAAVMIYGAVILGLGIGGVVIFVKAKKKKKFALEQGILPPPKKHKMANLFCNVGVASAITYFVVIFLLSLK